jgi:tetratricopeptide (TPR) repeat protein
MTTHALPDHLFEFALNRRGKMRRATWPLAVTLCVLLAAGAVPALAAPNDAKLCGHSPDPEAKLAACNRLISGGKLDKKNLAATYNNRGSYHFYKGDFDRAIAEFSQAIRVQAAAYSYANRGTAYSRKGDQERALIDLNEALRLDPKNDGAYFERGYIYFYKLDFEKAISDFGDAIRLNPKGGSAYAARGSVFNAKGDHGSAIRDLSDAIRLNPSDAQAYATRGASSLAKGEEDRALFDFDKALSLDPKLALAHLGRSSVAISRGQHAEALRHLEEAAKLAPKERIIFTNRGNVWRETGELDRALADYEQAIALDPKYPAPYNNRGLVWRARGDLDRAIAEFNQALRLDPDYADAYFHRGLAYEAKGERTRAMNDFRSAVAAPAKYLFSRRHQETARKRLTLLTSGDTTAPTSGLAAKPAFGAAERRIALVIGNGAYLTATPLNNPPNDARAVAKTLRGMSFEVSEGIDLTRENMQKAVNAFLREAASAKIALMFYAGHGMQIEGKNYLIPVDARLTDGKELAADLADVDGVLTALDDQIRTSVIILDACRDNPMAPKVAQLAAGRSVRVRSGLAAPSDLGKGATAGAGMLIAFATAPGQVALDGDDANSPFSAALVRHLATPNLEVQQMLTRVRAEVVSETKSKQVPWSNSSLLGEVYLGR